VDKSGVNHTVGSRCAAAKAFEIFERTAMYVSSHCNKGLGCRIRASEAEHLMTGVDQFSDDCGTDKACSSSHKNAHIVFLLEFMNSVDIDEAFTALGSRVETFAVINLHSRAEAGRPSLSINSCTQCSAESSACSDPNNWVTALKNAVNSRSAIVMRSGQGCLELCDAL
jgi:hypothetical protein